MISLTNLDVSYGEKNALNLSGISFSEGTITSVIGRNGCGKSTFLKVLSGVIPYKGEVKVDTDELSQIPGLLRARKISYLPQRLQNADMTVETLVSHGRFPWKSFPRTLTAKDIEIIHESIDKVGLTDHSSKSLKKISGGELKLAYIAMILAQQTDTILLDEPEAHLDIDHREKLYDMLSQLREEGKTIIIASHYIIETLSLSDKVIVIDSGEGVFWGDPGELTADKGLLKKSLGTSVNSSGNDDSLYDYYYSR